MLCFTLHCNDFGWLELNWFSFLFALSSLFWSPLVGFALDSATLFLIRLVWTRLLSGAFAVIYSQVRFISVVYSSLILTSYVFISVPSELI